MDALDGQAGESFGCDCEFPRLGNVDDEAGVRVNDTRTGGDARAAENPGQTSEEKESSKGEGRRQRGD